MKHSRWGGGWARGGEGEGKRGREAKGGGGAGCANGEITGVVERRVVEKRGRWGGGVLGVRNRETVGIWRWRGEQMAAGGLVGEQVSGWQEGKGGVRMKGMDMGGWRKGKRGNGGGGSDNGARGKTGERGRWRRREEKG